MSACVMCASKPADPVRGAVVLTGAKPGNTCAPCAQVTLIAYQQSLGALIRRLEREHAA